MNIERYEKLLDDQREALIHLGEEANHLRKALSAIKEINDRRPHDAAWREINGIIEGTRHGNCEKCCEDGDPSCPYYGEPDGCNDRKWRSEHYPTAETCDCVKETEKCTK